MLFNLPCIWGQNKVTNFRSKTGVNILHENQNCSVVLKNFRHIIVFVKSLLFCFFFLFGKTGSKFSKLLKSAGFKTIDWYWLLCSNHTLWIQVMFGKGSLIFRMQDQNARWGQNWKIFPSSSKLLTSRKLHGRMTVESDTFSLRSQSLDNFTAMNHAASV